MKEQLQLMNHSTGEDGKTEGHFLVEHTLECTHSREIYKQTDEIKMNTKQFVKQAHFEMQTGKYKRFEKIRFFRKCWEYGSNTFVILAIGT